MPMIFNLALATAGVLTTSATPNTETDAVFVKPGSTASVDICKVDVVGRGAGLTQISALVFRFRQFVTASTAGTALAAMKTDSSMGALVSTNGSRPTAGTTSTNGASFGCGATTPNVWMPTTPEAFIRMRAGSAASFDMFDASSLASATYEFGIELRE